MAQTGQIEALVGDSGTGDIQNPFHLHFKGEFRKWISEEGISLALTTYEGAKLIIIGPGMQGGTGVTERFFERCMATCVHNDSIYISSQHHIWKLENGLADPPHKDGWDRIYLPRAAYVTGGVDVHDIAFANDGKMYGVITGYNCIARIDDREKGSFVPYWRPSFITDMVPEDRCHLNGFCLEDGELRYASAVSTTDERGAWRAHKSDGGVLIDIQTDEIVCEGLAMPHTPRIYDGQLYVLEAGTGWIRRLDEKTGKMEKLLWRPGFLRGLRFYKHYAFVCSSVPRNKTFEGLPLDKELEDRGEQPRCAVDIIDMKTLEVVHSIEITGFVKEIYDVVLLPECRQPLLYGITQGDIRRIVVIDSDETDQGSLNSRKK